MPQKKCQLYVAAIAMALTIVSVAVAGVQTNGALSNGFSHNVNVVPSAGTNFDKLWGVNGSTVNAVDNESATSSAFVSGSNVFVAYRYYTGSSYDINGQVLNSAGQRQWGDKGVSIINSSTNDMDPIVIGSSTSIIVVCLTYSSSSPYNATVRAQKVDWNGNFPWGASPVAITTTSDAGFLTAISDGAGGAYIAWDDTPDSFDKANIFAQHINSSGAKQWASNGLVVCNAAYEQGHPSIAVDGGALYITWDDARGGSHYDIYVQKYDSVGTPLFAANGVQVCGATEDQTRPQIAIVQGNPIITWVDQRITFPASDIYAQRIQTSNGASVWSADGIVVCDAANQSQDVQICVNGGSLVIAWTDQRVSINDVNIYAQSVYLNGSVAWAANGMVIAGSTTSNETVPQLVVDTSGNIFIGWTDSVNEAPENVHMQVITPSGTLLFSSGYFVACGESGEQYLGYMLLDASGEGVYLFWDGPDAAGTSQVHVQHLTVSETGDDLPPPADTGWIVAVVIIAVVGGAIVLLYFLDKKGIINLKPLFEKIRGLFNKKT